MLASRNLKQQASNGSTDRWQSRARASFKSKRVKCDERPYMFALGEIFEKARVQALFAQA